MLLDTYYFSFYLFASLATCVTESVWSVATSCIQTQSLSRWAWPSSSSGCPPTSSFPGDGCIVSRRCSSDEHRHASDDDEEENGDEEEDVRMRSTTRFRTFIGVGGLGKGMIRLSRE